MIFSTITIFGKKNRELGQMVKNITFTMIIC